VPAMMSSSSIGAGEPFEVGRGVGAGEALNSTKERESDISGCCQELAGGVRS
jgi:hypothetical protein